jgi:OOP family OmpA-OmpF porin
MKRTLIALVVGAAALATTQVQAQNQFQTMMQTVQNARPYIGLGANFADHEYKLPGARDVRGDDYEAGFKIFGGADFDPIWGAEIGYTDFSKSDFTYTQGFVPARGKVEGYGVYIAGKGRWPVYPMVDVFGKLGVAYSHRKLESNIPLTTNSISKDIGLYAGVGLQWNITPQWGLVGEYERYGRSKRIGSSADVFSVSARFNF